MILLIQFSHNNFFFPQKTNHQKKGKERKGKEKGKKEMIFECVNLIDMLIDYS